MKTYSLENRFFRLALTLMLLAGLTLSVTPASTTLASAQVDLIGPAGSDRFGGNVIVLPNGNIVITDSEYSMGATAHVGAIYLYNGRTGALMSTLTGGTANDQVGYGGVTALTNGSYVVRSPDWTNGAATQAGAVTWCSGTTGCTGVVSASNSLVGSMANDHVGGTFSSGGITALDNGNYVVSSPYWNNGAATQAGAVTWCSGRAGCTGVVSASNSLVGSTADDEVGYFGITALSNDNYVVSSPFWTNGAAIGVGAVTWCSGTAGCTGVVSIANSLVGSTAYDWVGYSGVTALSNGNYVVSRPSWTNGTASNAGAVTWCSGTAGCTGAVSITNSLVGSTAEDRVGWGVTVLDNGNYVVNSYDWSNGAASHAGAVTWCSGTASCTGAVSASNSLVGSTADDRVGYDGVTALSNGNYVVRSTYWTNDAASNAGAVTWCSRTAGCTGAVSASNSLVGSTADDRVGLYGITALTNGNYVVSSSRWTNGAASSAGAVTWCSGTAGCTGAVSIANSLVGSTAYDWVGSNGVTALTNGNYVVRSPGWNSAGGAVTWCSGTAGCTGEVSVTNSLVGSTTHDNVGNELTVLSNGNYVVSSQYWNNGAVTCAGAVTWCSGTVGCSGAVSASNSLVGSTAWDRVGFGITALTNGNYVVRSRYWDNSGAIDAGAVTWCSGTAGCTGAVLASNSLVGSTADDQVGLYGDMALTNGNYVVGSPFWHNGVASSAGAATWCNGMVGCTGAVSASNSLVGSTTGDKIGSYVTALTNGSYVVCSRNWTNGAATHAGAVSWCSGTAGCTGAVNSDNSVLGMAANGGANLTFAYDSFNDQLVVGRPSDNRVTLFKTAPNHTVYLPLILR